MGKKSKIRRQKKQIKSARGHVEQAVDRYRLKELWIPIDENGNEIEGQALAPPPKMLPSERRALAKAMLEQTGGTTSVEKSLQPEPDVSPPPPKATNVVSLCERRAANEETKLSASQETQATINYERMLYHQWSKDKNKRYFSKKELYALEFRQLLEYAAAHPNGRNEEPPTVKAEVQKPISIVHNPGISANPINPETEAGGYKVDNRARSVSVHNQRNRDQAEWYRKFGDMSSKPSGKTPSGRLIREFTENIQPSQPPEKSTEVRRSKDWGRAKLPGSNGARAWAAEDQLFTMIDMVPEEHWPMEHIEQFLFKGDDGKWHVHTGKVRQAISNQEDRIINRAVTLAFIQYGEDQQEFIKHLESELKSIKTHFNILDFQYSTLIGEPTDHGVTGTVQYLRAKQNNYATAYAKPPEDVGKLVAEFGLFNKLVQTMGASEAYSRFHYGTPDVAKQVEAECQRRIEQRAAEAQPKMQMLRLKAFFRQVPVLIKLQRERDYMQQLSAKHILVARETYALRQMHKRNHKPALVKKAYLSGLVIEQVRFHEKWKVTMNGKDVVADVVDVTCHKYVTALKQPAHNYRREFDKQLKVRPRPTYEEVVPTVCMKGVPVVLTRLEDHVNRWQQWVDQCLDRDAERQAAELEAQQQTALAAEVERFKEIQNKPINKLVGNIVRGLTTLKKIGDKDVYVTKKERAEREENARILRERTENEIREQEKLAEKERREEAEREARRADRRSKRARKKAEKRAAQAKAEEQARLKAAAKKAFRAAH